MRIRFNRPVKRLLPRSLLGRNLLMILIPLVLLQAVALRIFYGTYLDLLSRRLSGSVAGEIATTIDLLERFPNAADRVWILRRAHQQYDLIIRLEPGARLANTHHSEVIGPFDDNLVQALTQDIHRPFSMTWNWSGDPREVLIRVQLREGVLHIEAPRKRLYVASIYFFVLWLVGSALILFAIAALFMRNQVRAIRRLSAAAEAFGLGRDPGPIRPGGAIEVRQAATAFNRMRERLMRFVTQRTEMLAGVSHDLRTPLTRLRLALAVLPRRDSDAAAEFAAMEADLNEMERMIGDYLAFARGEGAEQPQPVNLSVVLEDVAASARRAGTDITLSIPPDLILPLRADALRRAVTNLVDNAHRHGQRVFLTASVSGNAVQICVDDDGPGIPPNLRENVFRPFASGTAGGTGLGLTIARDVVRAHGGEIILEDSPLGGLRARIRLPL